MRKLAIGTLVAAGIAAVTAKMLFHRRKYVTVYPKEINTLDAAHKGF